MPYFTKVLSKYTIVISDQRDTYIRFGELPSSGNSHDFHRKRDLKGISVYPAVKRDGVWFVQGDTVHPTFGELADAFAEGERPAYLVRGVEVGYGPDREPLIKDPKIIKELKWGEISDHEGKISRGMYNRRLREIGDPKEKEAELAYFKAHAKEYDPTLDWTYYTDLMNDDELKTAAHKWYYEDAS